MWIKRDISEKIADLTKVRPAILVTGARQTGKTSLLRHLFPDAEYVSFDWPANADEAENNPSAFLSRFNGPVILDEIQYVPSLFRHLKIAIDQNRQQTGKWLLTGSQKFQLMKEVSETLAGRIGIVELDTLSANEIRCNGLDVGQYLVRGGYPELWANPTLEREQFFRDYVLTYLERDLKKILDVSNLRAFDRFVRSTALRVGQLTNFTQTAQDAGVTSVTGKKWFEVLEASNLCVALEPYFNNKLKRLVKSPKIYFKDPGLLNFLLNLRTQDDIRNSHYYGALFENLVYNELARQAELKQFQRSLFFLRDKNNLEVDFLVEKGDTIKLIEAKTAEYPRDAADNLRKIKTLFSPSQKVELYVACQTTAAAPQVIGDCTFYNPLRHYIEW